MSAADLIYSMSKPLTLTRKTEIIGQGVRDAVHIILDLKRDHINQFLQNVKNVKATMTASNTCYIWSTHIWWPECISAAQCSLYNCSTAVCSVYNCSTGLFSVIVESKIISFTIYEFVYIDKPTS